MGWTSVGSKVGRLILDSSQPLINQLNRSSPRQPDSESPAAAAAAAQDEKSFEPSCSRTGVEFQGPDTSSLSAFLYSFISSDRTGHAETSAGEYEDEGGEADWFVVSANELDKSIVEDYMSSHAQPLRIPPLSEDSCLLCEDFRSILYASLPRIVHGRHWILLYSTARDGISLLTLYRKSSLLPGPCLLVAGDSKGAVFGGLLLAPLKPSRKKYQGSNQTFVFTNVSGQPKVFPATGKNRYYFLCSSDSLAIGGGGRFALHLDSDLLTGSSGPCETFDSCGLAHAEDFDLKDVELWGFAYTTKYGTRS